MSIKVNVDSKSKQPLCVIGGDHHIHSHQYQNFVTENGIPNRIERGIEALKVGYAEAVRLKLPFVLNGDLMHNKNSIDPIVASQLTEFFTEANPVSPIYLVVGNHEKPDKYRNISTLDIFKYTPNVMVVNEPTVVEMEGKKLLMVPFEYDHMSMVARLDEFEADIFVGHYPNSGVDLGHHDLLCDVKFEDFKPERYELLLFNDIHKHQPIGNNGYHLGATMQNNFGEAEYECGWWLLSMESDEYYIDRIDTNAPTFHYVDTPEEAEAAFLKGNYARVKPKTVIKNQLNKTEQARIQTTGKKMEDILESYVDYQVESGKFEKERRNEILEAAKKVI